MTAGLNQPTLKTALGIDQDVDLLTLNSLNATEQDPEGEGAWVYKQNIEVQDTVTMLTTLLSNDSSSYASFAVLASQAIARAVRLSRWQLACLVLQSSLHMQLPWFANAHASSACLVHSGITATCRGCSHAIKVDTSTSFVQLHHRATADAQAVVQALAATVTDADNGYNNTNPALDLTNAQVVQTIIYGMKAWVSTTSDTALPSVRTAAHAKQQLRLREYSPHAMLCNLPGCLQFLLGAAHAKL